MYCCPATLAVTSILVCVLLAEVDGQNILKNADFESKVSKNDWKCHQCTISESSDAYKGKLSVLVAHRSKTQGLYQTVQVTPGKRYFFKAYVKLVTLHPGYLYHGIDYKIQRTDENGKKVHDVVSRSPYVQLGSGWHAIGGDYLVPAGTHSVDVVIDVDPGDVQYLVDDAVFEEIPSLTNFKAEADMRIETLRKANVTIRLDRAGASVPRLDIELLQTYSEFIIGSGIDSKTFLDPAMTAYRDYFYNNFEWAVPDGFQWHQSEHQEGRVTYEKANKTVDILLAHGKKIEAHNIFWDNPLHVPKWLHNKSSTDMRQIMARRIKELVGGFRGRVLHWDVNNENQHNDFFETHLHDPNVTMWMFEEANKADPNTKLFLNDFGIVSKHHHFTMSYIEQAKSFVKAGVPIHGIGIESHFDDVMDISAVKFRLDQVAEVGLPIMIAALNVGVKDVNKRAQIYEDLYRLYFSHPAVVGITQWHFSEIHGSKTANTNLVDGPSMTPNAAGMIVRQLRWEDWRTNKNLTISHGQDIHLRAFKGDYKLRVRHGGMVIHEEDFTLGERGADIMVSLTGSASRPEVDHLLIG